MVKTLISPLTWFLLLCAGCSWIGLKEMGRSWRRRFADRCLMTLTIAIWLLATPYVSSVLTRSISISGGQTPDPVRPAKVIVLAGGSFFGADHRYYLGTSTLERVIRGVEVFRQSPAASMVMSGRSQGSEPASEVSLMKDLAAHLGVSPERIQMEADSRTTFEHAPRIIQHGLAQRTDPIILVTDAIHLRRAIGEFRRSFSSITPVPAVVQAPVSAVALQSWIPQADCLDQSTRVLQEWIGIAWYRIRHAAGEAGA